MKWSKEAAAIHRITEESLVHQGVDIQTVMSWFANDCKNADYIIAHNLQFDKTVILSEAMRLHEADAAFPEPEKWWRPTKDQEICTMKISTPLCAILAKKSTPEDPYKWPTLTELFRWLFPKTAEPTNLHDASADVECLVRCVRELLQRRLLVLEPRFPRNSDRFVNLLRAMFRWIA
jgi:DNA polymerase III epsilon subunit-like protein